MATPRLDVLGVARLSYGDSVVKLTPRERAVLAALALRSPRPAPFDDLIAMVWGSEPPKTARASLQNAIATIRSKSGLDDLIETDSGTYRLGDGVAVDTASVVNEISATVAADTTPASVDALRRGLDRWGPEPFADLEGQTDVVAARTRLNAIRDAAVDQLGAALLAAGRTDEAVGHLEAAVLDAPARASRAALLAVALHRSGATADAVTVLDLAERRSVKTSGIGLPAGAAALRSRILDDDPALHDSAVLDELRRDVGRAADGGPLIGRAEEVATVLDRVRRRSAIVVEGRGGLGKTALLDEVSTRLGGLVARTTCVENPQSPYEPWLAILEAIAATPAGAAALRASLPTCDPGALAWVAPAVAALDGQIDPVPRLELRRERADRALADLVSAVGRRCDLVVVIDDLHLAPDTSIGILEAVATTGDAAIIAAGRPRDRLTAMQAVGTLALEPLTRETVTALVRRLLDAPEDRVADVSDALMERTGGNAFFLVATVRHLLDTGALRRTGTTWHLTGETSVPPTVEVAVAGRLDVLSARARQVVELVAIAADPVDRRVILDALGADAGRGIEEAIAEGLLVDRSDEIGTIHDLLGEATRGLLPDARAVELHDRLARLYERGDRADWIARAARHRFGARELDPGAAVEALERAATDALARVHPEFAVNDLARAREIVDAPRSEHGLRLAVAEGSARREAGDPTYADVLREAAFTAHTEGLDELTADALIELGDVGLLTGPGGADTDVTHLVEEVLANLNDPIRSARVRSTASVWYAMGPEWARGHELWAQALADAERTGDDAVICEVLRLLDRGTDGPHQAQQRIDLGRRCIELGERLEDPLAVYRGHLAGFGAMMQLGTGDELDAHIAAMEALEPVVHNGRGRRVLSYFRAGRAHLHGELAAAEGFLNAASGFPNVLSESWDLLASSSVLLTVRIEQGRGGELAPLAEAMAEAHPDMGVWLAAAARCALEGGDRRRAAEMVHRLHSSDYETVSMDQVWLVAMTSAARVAAACDRLDIAENVAGLLQPYRANGVWVGHGGYDPVDISLALAALAMGDTSEAADRVDDALAVARRLRAPIFEGRATVLAARIAANDTNQADRWGDIEGELRRTHQRATDNGWTALAVEAAEALGG